MKSHFFAYISKIRWLQRWGLKRNAVAENEMEHSWGVSARGFHVPYQVQSVFVVNIRPLQIAIFA